MRATMTLLLAVLLSFCLAVTSFAAIDGSPHDLATGSAGLEYQICSYCHTPHNANIGGVEKYPLWSMPTVAAGTGYTNYASSTMDSALTLNADPLAGPSRLCMSCHDGTVAMDSAVNAVDTKMTLALNGANFISVDLSDDHPIGINYDTAIGLDDELRATSTAYVGTRTISDYLFGSILTCASCHDVHTPDPDNIALTEGSFLVKGNDNSALCLSCHIK